MLTEVQPELQVFTDPGGFSCDLPGAPRRRSPDPGGGRRSRRCCSSCSICSGDRTSLNSILVESRMVLISDLVRCMCSSIRTAAESRIARTASRVWSSCASMTFFHSSDKTALRSDEGDAFHTLAGDSGVDQCTKHHPDCQYGYKQKS